MTLRELLGGVRFDPTLSDPLASAAEKLTDAALDTPITSLAYRADEVTSGALFFCVRGFTADGHDFAPAALDSGAVAFVCERRLKLRAPEIVVPDVRAAMAPLAASFYGHPSETLDVVGVTGTNGKTTTTFLLRQILEARGRRTGLLGTVLSVVAGKTERVERTTPEAVDLQRTLKRMADAGDRACVMEVSSHALELHRADSIDFDCAVFTNLTQDHLDFHGTLESYFEAKLRLFASPSPPRTSVVNVDDEWGRELVQALRDRDEIRVVTYAIDRDANSRAVALGSNAAGSRFTWEYGGDSIEVELPLPGRFNVYNALASLTASSALRVEPRRAAGVLACAERVPGRFEPVSEGQHFTVLVDYAHTPDSLENVLSAARELLELEGDGGRLICVFGAGGDRDREKRPLMGAVARRLADEVIVTSDNPRSENPQAIIDGILAGAEGGMGGERSALEVEPDRRAAIAKAIGHARPGDVVLIAGKGHEQGQEFANGRKVPFDDREVAREELRALESLL